MDRSLKEIVGVFRLKPWARTDRTFERRALARLTALGLLMAIGSSPALAQGTLRIGMTAADIPLTTGQTDQGGEGMRFMGYTVYDGLLNWDLSSADKPSGLVPGLATAWKVDDGDKTRWVFTLRDGVKFHDGSDFKADAVVWNLDKLLNDKSPQYDSKQAAQGRSRIPSVKSYKVLDDKTVEIHTATPDAFLPYQIGWVMMSSPAQWEKVGRDWNKFAQTPSGTGPWKLTSFVPQTRAELAACRSGLQPVQAGERQDSDFGLGFGPDAAVADERVYPAEPRRGRHQGRLRRGRVEHDDQHVARGRQVRDGARRQRSQLHLLHPRPGPLLQDRPN